jgi:hypothetical protein
MFNRLHAHWLKVTEDMDHAESFSQELILWMDDHDYSSMILWMDEHHEYVLL